MLGKTVFFKINLKYYFFPPKPKEDILIARDILYAPTVKLLDWTLQSAMARSLKEMFQMAGSKI
jgi:hypothetical protein